MKTPKAVVGFNGRRDSYQLATALQEGDLLARFMTDLYFPLDNPLFRATIGRILPSSKTELRYNVQLKSKDVQILGRLLLTGTMIRLQPWRLNELNHRGNFILGNALREYAKHHQTPIFTYSYYAQAAFRPHWDGLPYRFLFQVHPQLDTTVELLRDEVERTPEGRASLLHEYEMSISSEELAALANESRWANGWTVASNYTASTLVAQGIPRKKIHVVPYGIDHARFPARESSPDFKAPFTVIFIGTLGQRKGLADLLQAIRLLQTRQIRVLLCGRGFVDKDLLGAYRDVPYKVLYNLSHPELIHKLCDSDVFAFPTLLEGFAQVILESMASGVPVISTNHSAAPDLYRDGNEGFIIPIRSPERLAERIAWGMDHREELAEMGRRAAGRAQVFTWARFREGIRHAYMEMIRAVDSNT
jgi:glycosyltransferase involved in cell wall biosynthesis